MKRHIRFIGLLIAIMVVFLVPTFAIAIDEEVFNDSFCQPFNPNPKRPFGLRELAYLDDVFYGYLGNAIYTWKPSDALPTKFCTIPTVPDWKEEWRGKALKDISAEDQTALSSAVEYIAEGDGALWGYNTLSGKIGKISQQGISWAAQTIDTSCLFQDGSFMLSVVPIQSFVDNGKLYVFGDDNEYIVSVSDPMALLSFDMSNGESNVLKTNTAINCCRYKPGYFLLLRRGDSSSMILSTLNMKTGTIEDLSLTVPFPDYTDEGLESVGGVAYDSKSDQVFFSMKSQVWKSTGGEPFQSVNKLPMDTDYRMRAWVLQDGRYALLSRSLWIRDVE